MDQRNQIAEKVTAIKNKPEKNNRQAKKHSMRLYRNI